ncbi:tyrosine-type recombinase/integrase [Streptomyces sp. URMC 125]|uniref:tyrosine-type recombinase/integrase n=1 Tax=Streptomyces sp. URMC 125 TaxID=3423419 RepID=UPI003F19F51F
MRDCRVSPAGQRALVSTTPTGRPLDSAGLTRRFRGRAGLRRIRFHDLRHSTATLLLEQGAELVVIKELLGHAHIGVTATVYAHVRLRLRLQRDAIDLLGQTLGVRPRVRRRRRPAALCGTRPLTLPSSTAVKRLRIPVEMCLDGDPEFFPSSARQSALNRH